MAGAVERLEFLLNLNPGNTITGLKNVGDSAEKELGKVDSHSKVSSASLTKFGVGAVASAALVGTALIKTAGSFEDLAIASGKGAAATGLSVEQFSRLKETANDAGVETDALTAGLSKMNQAAGKSPQVFADLGIQIVKTKDGATDVQATFLNVVDALNAMTDPVARQNAAQALLGRGWKDMAELIQDGSASIKTAMAQVSSGQVITSDELAKAKEYRANLDNLSDSLKNLVLGIGQGAAPVIGQLANGLSHLVDWFGKANEFTDGAVGKFAALGAAGLAAVGAIAFVAGQMSKLKDVLVVTTKATTANTVATEENTVAQEENTVALTGVGKAAVLGGVAIAGYGAYNAIASSQAEHHAAVVKELAKDMDILTTTATSSADILHYYLGVLIGNAEQGKSTAQTNMELATSHLEVAKAIVAAAKESGVWNVDLATLSLAIDKATATASDMADMSAHARDEIGGVQEVVVKTTPVVDHLSDAFVTAAYQTRDVGIAHQTTTAAVDAAEKAFDAETAALQRNIDQSLAAIGTEQAYNEQVLQTNIDLEAYTKTLDSHKLKGEELMLATAKMGDEIEATAKQFALQQGAVDGSRDSIDKQVWSLSQTRNTLDPSSALYQYLDAYIKRLQDIPTDISTNVDTNYHSNGGPVRHAQGGVFTSPHVGMVAEDGAEAVVPLTKPGRAAAILQQAGLLGAPASGGHTIININTGADPREVITIVKQYVKNGGQI